MSNVGGGDHFAKPGANDRIWNALEKLCLRDPAVFAAYYGNAVIALVSEAWLGPSYQITSQLNVVNPGGAAQVRASRLSSRLPVGGGDRALSRPRPPSLAGADAARRGRPLRHAARDRTDALPAVLAELPARLYGDGAARSFATISTSIMSSCRSPRATRCFSIRLCSTPPERTARRTCAASPICCRSPRLSAARWRASTGSR